MNSQRGNLFQFKLGTLRLLGVVFPLIAVYIMIQQGKTLFAHFFIVISIHFTFIKVIGPLGWDLTLARNLRFPLMAPKESQALVYKATLRTLRNSFLLSPPFLASIFFAMRNQDIGSLLIQSILLICSMITVSLTSLYLAAIRNSTRILKGQFVDIAMNLILPSILAVLLLQSGLDLYLSYILLLLLGSIICLGFVFRILIECELLPKFRAGKFFDSSNSSEAPRGQIPSVLLIGLNSRILLILASWISTSDQMIVIDLLSKSIVVIGFVAWTSGNTYSESFIDFPNQTSFRIWQKQLRLLVLFWFLSNLSITFLALAAYREYYLNWNTSIPVHVSIVLISLFEIPSSLGGYIMLQKSLFSPLIVAQAIYAFVLIFAITFAGNQLRFWALSVIASLARSLIYLHSLDPKFSFRLIGRMAHNSPQVRHKE